MAMSIDAESGDSGAGLPPVVLADLAGWVWQMEEDSIIWADRRLSSQRHCTDDAGFDCPRS